MPGLMYDELLSSITDQIDNYVKKRYFMALSGPPASGKSTISEKLKVTLIQKDMKLVSSKWTVFITMTRF